MARRSHTWARALSACLLAVATGLGVAAPATATPAEETLRSGLYLVTFGDTPLAAYAGDVDGYAATSPEPGERFDDDRSEVELYRDRLRRRQDRILAEVGSPEVVYRYTTVVSGVAVRLSSDQVRDLRSLAGVRAVERDTRAHLDDTGAAELLDLPGARGAWARTGGTEQAGRGVVIGVVDSGLWPDNPSFAAPSLPDDGAPPGLEGFTGGCQSGERWSAEECNQKVVAARYFVKAFGTDNVANAEYLSPRDAQGHGSHVAATAAGNADVRMTIAGESLGETSGMAPAAAVAAYKACWAAPNPEDDGCAAADLLRAVDQAVADGVDVLSFPVSGQVQAGTAMRQAFRNATAAGVLVVTSAGNRGGRGVSPSSPWTTTAGATTYRLFQGAAVLGDGTRLVGADISEQSVPASPAVLGTDARAADAERSEAALCAPGSLDARVVAGKVVVCWRGVTARVEKSRTVKRAGGRAMVLLNTDPGAVEADFHAVPTVHLDEAAGARLETYLRTAGPRARIAIDPTAEDEAAVPGLADFSGRGTRDDADVVKPDLVAPGVSVLAAVAPTTRAGRDWDVLSGTSMAAAHVSGLAAMVRAEHPAWSPAAVRSALMTTAYDVVGEPDGVLAQGAGHVDPSRFLDPGLVFDTGDSFEVRSTPAVNTPSVAVGDLVGRAVVRRTVTNVSGRAETYNATVTGLPGVDVSVVPATFRLRAGESRTLRVRFVARQGARYDRFVSGHLSLSGSQGHVARIPLAVRALRLRAPDELLGVGTSGSLRVTGRAGMTGNVPVDVTGLVGSLPDDLTLTPGRFDPGRPTAGPTAHRAVFDVGPDAAAVRFDVLGRSEGANFDLYVYRDGELVRAETGAAGDEQVTLLEPSPGSYEVFTHLRSTADNAPNGGVFTGWVVPDDDTDTLEVADSVRLQGGEPFSLRAGWDRLESSQTWFGLVRFGAGADRVVTPVTVD